MHDVLIIGAGLAGLVAGYELKKALPNLDVLLLEANDYPGGRMLTTSYGGELGGEILGHSKTPLFQLTQELNVECSIMPLTMAEQTFSLAYYFQKYGEWVNQNQWKDWQKNPAPEQLKMIPPVMMNHYFLKDAAKPDWDSLLDDEQVRRYAGMSIQALLKAHGAPDSLLPFINSNSELNGDIDEVSSFSALLTTWLMMEIAQGEIFSIKQGNQLLAKTLAGNLDIQYGFFTSEIKKTPSGYTVYARDGAQQSATHVVFALPTKPFLGIDKNFSLPKPQQVAIEAMKYTPIIKAFFKFNQKKWQDDGIPLTMWTDGIAGYVAPVYDIDTRESFFKGDTIWGLETMTTRRAAIQLAQRELETGESVSEQIIQYLYDIRPSLHGRLEYEEHINWTEQETVLGGFNYFAPDEKIPDYYRCIAEPFENLFFAGEHTEYRARGFQAAANSGFRVAKEVQGKLLK